MSLQTVTPESEAQVAAMRAELRAWLERKRDEGVPHHIVVTALGLMAASGAVSREISREDFVDVMGEYWDAYKRRERHE